MAQRFDFVIVGSGINSLCCAALLAKKGYQGVCAGTQRLSRWLY